MKKIIFFAGNTSIGQTPRLTLKCDGSNDAKSPKGVHVAVRKIILTFSPFCPSKRQIFPKPDFFRPKTINIVKNLT